MSTEASSMNANVVTLDRESLGRGVAFGAVSYLAGYLLAVPVAFGKIGETIPEFVPVWKGGWWFFYNAHMVDIAVSASGDISGTTTGSFLGNSTDPVAQLLYLVPPLFLFIEGGLLALNMNLTADMAEAAKAGALGIVGYLPLAVIGVFLTTHSGTRTESVSQGILETSFSASYSYSIELVPALLLAGIIYPVLFGALGGAVASKLEED